MKPQDRPLVRQAYLDDQLPIEEVIALESTLSPREKAALEREAAFHSALAARLRADEPCPDALWERVRRELPAPAPAPAASRTWTLWPGRRARPWLAAAAAALVVFAGLAAILAGPRLHAHNELDLGLDRDAAALIAAADIRGDYRQVGAGLAAQGLQVNLAQPPPEASGKIQLLGMRTVHTRAGTFAQVHFTCCGQTMCALIGSKEALDMSRIPCRCLSGECQMGTKEVGGYRILVVGRHAPAELLKLFS